MAIVANLTPTPVPAGSSIGGMPQMVYHVTVTPAGGAGTYSFNHGLPYAPTFALVIARLADATAPSATNSLVGFCPADTTAVILAFNVAGNGTYDILYG